MAKKLFVLVSNEGDGSYHPRFTMNEEWILQQEEREEDGELDYDTDIGYDGDGFHYSVLTVPDDATLESLGISWDCAQP